MNLNSENKGILSYPILPYPMMHKKNIFRSVAFDSYIKAFQFEALNSIFKRKFKLFKNGFDTVDIGSFWK